MKSDQERLKDPWLIAVWPGMGQVALAGGYYLMAKLGMRLLAEFPSKDLFDVEQVEVRNGLIVSGRMPRSRLYLWKDPGSKHDILLFIGEAQPPLGKYAFCHNLIEYATKMGVKRVITFAAMATQMHPENESRVYCVATDEAGLDEVLGLDTVTLRDGQISGLNGVLLGVAAEVGVQGIGLLGEMPHIFAQFPYPKASLAVLRIFASLAEIAIDLAELAEQAAAVDEQLGQLLSQVEHQLASQSEAREELDEVSESIDSGLRPEEERRIERLFEQAKKDRSKAYELKGELDRLQVFKDYEDRFLDLFRS